MKAGAEIDEKASIFMAMRWFYRDGGVGQLIAFFIRVDGRVFLSTHFSGERIDLGTYENSICSYANFCMCAILLFSCGIPKLLVDKADRDFGGNFGDSVPILHL